MHKIHNLVKGLFIRTFLAFMRDSAGGVIHARCACIRWPSCTFFGSKLTPSRARRPFSHSLTLSPSLRLALGRWSACVCMSPTQGRGPAHAIDHAPRVPGYYVTPARAHTIDRQTQRETQGHSTGTETRAGARTHLYPGPHHRRDWLSQGNRLPPSA